MTDEELDAAETRLGVRLPAAVREAYRLIGRRTDLTSENGTPLAWVEMVLWESAPRLLGQRGLTSEGRIRCGAGQGAGCASSARPDNPREAGAARA